MKVESRTEMWVACSAIAFSLAATSAIATTPNKPLVDNKSPELPAARSYGFNKVSRGLAETCTTIDISGSIDPEQNGEYVDVGMTTTQDKPIFFTTEGGTWVMFFMDMSFSSSDFDTSDMEGPPEDARNGTEVRRRSLRAGNVDEITRWHTQHQSFRSLGSLSIPRGGGKMASLGNVAHAVSASKAACGDGMWILLPFPFSEDSETYPVYISFDCADHPVDITAPWIVIADDESTGEETDEALSFTCPEEASTQCINLGAAGCESRDECCSANDLNTYVKCWDDRCCNKAGKPCTKDSQCCDGLSCMDDSLCANPDADQCVSLGVSGCSKTADCCSANNLSASTRCNQGRCCNKDDGGCEIDADCCEGYMCNMTTSMCMME